MPRCLDFIFLETWSPFLFFNFILVLCVCPCTHSTHGGQKMALDLLELKLQEVMSRLITAVLEEGTEFWSSRIANALNHQPSPTLFFVKAVLSI